MVFDGRWKLIHAEGGFRPDAVRHWKPTRNEFAKIWGHRSGRVSAQIDRLMDMLGHWARRPAQRTTISRQESILAMAAARLGAIGIIIGAVGPEELAPDLRAKISGKPKKDYR